MLGYAYPKIVGEVLGMAIALGIILIVALILVTVNTCETQAKRRSPAKTKGFGIGSDWS